METICEYHFDTVEHGRINASMRWDDPSEMVIYTYEGHPEMDHAKSGQWLKNTLSQKTYDELFKYNKVLLDFLNGRLS